MTSKSLSEIVILLLEVIFIVALGIIFTHITYNLASDYIYDGDSLVTIAYIICVVLVWLHVIFSSWMLVFGHFFPFVGGWP